MTAKERTIGKWSTIVESGRSLYYPRMTHLAAIVLKHPKLVAMRRICMAAIAAIDVLTCIPKRASAATYQAAVSQTGTPFSVGVTAYPRLANLYGFKSADQ